MKTAFVVLGMHRSGTSATAGALALLGAAPPRTLMRAAPDNPRGFWESEVVMALNDRILMAAGSAWDDARPFDMSALAGAAGDAWRAEAHAVLAREFEDAAAIVLKDPRICRFYPFWRDVLMTVGYRPLAISPIRAPAEVAASLASRNAMPFSQALELWARHVLDAERDSRDDPRLFMDWRDLIGDWRHQAARLSTMLGRPLMPADPGALDAFLSAELSSRQAPPEAVPDDILALHARLTTLANAATC